MEKRTYQQIPEPPQQLKRKNPFAIDQSYLLPTSSPTKIITRKYRNKLKPVQAQKKQKGASQIPYTHIYGAQMDMLLSFSLSSVLGEAKKVERERKLKRGKRKRRRRIISDFSSFILFSKIKNYFILFYQYFFSPCW